MLPIGLSGVEVEKEVYDGTLGEGGVVCVRRGRDCSCDESRGASVILVGRRSGHRQQLRTS